MHTTSTSPTEEFAGLPGASGGPTRPLRICIASYDFVGPVRNGGVGTAFTSLGEALAAAGHEVTLLYASGDFCENQNLRHWIEEYQKKNIRFVPLTGFPKLKLGGSFHMSRSYEVYLWLRSQQFDVIHFSEWRAPGYYSLVAKHQDLAFQNTTLSVNTHGPSLWSLLGSGDYLTQISDVELDFMERQSVKLADVVISPSHYLFRWMREQGWELPQRHYVHQNILPANARSGTAKVSRQAGPVRELVFFGRLETRKGLVLLCDALDRLVNEPDVASLRLTFLGKVAKINQQDSLQYLQARSRKWAWSWKIISDLDQHGALSYMQGPGRLAVIPSQTDNLPYTVLECLGAGVAFLASNIGGIPEMVHLEDRAEILFPLRPPALAAKILEAVRRGVRPARFACEPAATEQGWLDWHNSLATDGLDLSVSDNLLDVPLVSVCMSHFNRPHYLQQALASLRAQDYQNFEVVLVDDASTKPEAVAYIDSLEAEFEQRGWQLIRNREELFVGAARNLAARHARGEYLMFMDDDNIAKPEELTMFVKVARKTNADTVSCCLDFFSTEEPPTPGRLPDQRFLFLGPAASASALRNYLGDTNTLFRREIFLKLGGFHEERGVGHEDWELLGDAVLKGYRHEVIPEALVWYRRLNGGDSATAKNSLHRGHMRNIRPFLDAVPPALRTLVLFAQGQVVDAHSQVGGAAAAQIAYLQHSLRWRSLYEAGRELYAAQQPQAASKLMKAALSAASTTQSPKVLLEALLAVGAEMHATNDPDAAQVLRLAVELARQFKQTADADYAASLLATETKKTSKAAAVATSPGKPKAAALAAASPLVSIIIPVFNNLALTRRCLSSLTAIRTSVPHEIIVVDNASNDGTAEFLKSESAQGKLRALINAKNEGFARGCNRGAEAARGSILLFLNNDTQVTAGWLEPLVKAAQQPGVGVVGAKLLYADGTIQHAGIEFINGIPDHPHRHAPGTAPAANQGRELDMVTGACYMVHRPLFLKLAGFDEVYRNGVEDVDLCLRVRASGSKVIYEPQSVVYHLEGQSEGRFNHVSENLKIFFARWSACFDKNWRFIVPATPRFTAASQSLLPTTADEPAAAAPQPPADFHPAVVWEGSFLDYGSMSHTNREFSSRLESTMNLTRVGSAVLNGRAQSDPALQHCARLLADRAPEGAAVTVRHQWPPNWSRPAGGALVLFQPWEFGALPEAWVKAAGNVDEFWVPSPAVRDMYYDSGIAPEKVRVVPNGVDSKKFRPGVPPLALPTRKKFKFLFVGGTIFRKGPDVLLEAFARSFSAADDVCLVIKDFGGDSFYQGQTAESAIRALQQNPAAPEIVYLNEELSADQMPSLYAACDCFVLPYRGEGFGMPVLEAMACGLPVIVTAGGATDSFVSVEAGWRIPSQRSQLTDRIGDLKLVAKGWLLSPSTAHLGDLMKYAASHPAECRARGAAGRSVVEARFDWDIIAVAAANRLRELAARAASKPVTPPAPAAPSQSVSASTPVKLPSTALVGQLAEARQLFARKDLAGAWQAAAEAVARRPFHPEAFLLLAEVALAAGAGKMARLCAQRARDLAPNWPAARQLLARPMKGDAKPDWLQSSVVLHQPAAPRLSVCLIVKNEERFLAQCLKSVRGLGSQIIVVDTGSTDRTVEIAREFGAEIYSFAWCDDFAAARNAALEHATGDWILMLDADEELPAPQHARLLADMKHTSIIACRLPLVNVGQENEGQSYVPRLFRNLPGAFFKGRIHEQIFGGLLERARQWGLKTALGTAEILHHGYSQALVGDRNKIERNLKLLRTALQEDPADVNLLMNFGMELVRSEDLPAGIEKYREAYRMMSSQPADELAPELREVLLTQFTSQLYKIRAHDEIVAVLNSTLAQSGGLTASLHFALGLAHFELKQFREAADQMRQCLAKRKQRCLTPINTDIHTAAPQHCLALCLAQLGEVAEADQAFAAALTATGHAENARLDYAKFLQAQGRPVEALHQLHALVTASPRRVAAWQLGGEIAMSRPDFLEFALDWTAEAFKTLPENPLIAAQRAEALTLNNQAAAAAPLWETLWRSEPDPRSLAALVLCELAGGQITHAPNEGRDEETASIAFAQWYQKLIAARAKPLLESVNGRLEALSRVLPTAAKMLQNALSETDAPIEA